MAIASVISTAEDTQEIDGHRVQVVIGRPVGARTQSKFFVGTVPIRPPRADQWATPFLNVRCSSRRRSTRLRSRAFPISISTARWNFCWEIGCDERAAPARHSCASDPWASRDRGRGRARLSTVAAGTRPLCDRHAGDPTRGPERAGQLPALAEEPKRRRDRTISFALAGLSVFVVGWLLVDAVGWVSSAFQHSPVLGVLAGVAVAGGIAGAGAIIGRELTSLFRLKTVEAIHQRLSGPAEQIPTADARKAIGEILAVVPRDRETRNAIEAFQRQVSLIIRRNSRSKSAACGDAAARPARRGACPHRCAARVRHHRD